MWTAFSAGIVYEGPSGCCIFAGIIVDPLLAALQRGSHGLSDLVSMFWATRLKAYHPQEASPSLPQ
jgi:hypothetical protein